MPLEDITPSRFQSTNKNMETAVGRLRTALDVSVDTVTKKHVDYFREVGTDGALVLLLSALAKDAVNTLTFVKEMSPSEAVRVHAATRDLLTEQPIDQTISDLTDKEVFLAKAVALAYSGGALEGAVWEIPAKFRVVEILPGGAVMTGSLPDPEPEVE